MAFDFFRKYEIAWQKSAIKQLSKLPKKDRLKIIDSIGALSANPDAADLKKLSGFRDLFRLRVSDYRIILHCNKSKKMTVVTYIGHRKEVYNALKRLSLFSSYH